MKDSDLQTIEKVWPRRYTVVAMSCAAIFICYLDRVNISVAIIPMSEDLGWAPDKQGLILSSFFVGYLLTQILGGQLADKYGGKAVLAIGVLVWSVSTLFTPPAAAAGFAVLIAARIAMGVVPPGGRAGVPRQELVARRLGAARIRDLLLDPGRRGDVRLLGRHR